MAIPVRWTGVFSFHENMLFGKKERADTRRRSRVSFSAQVQRTHMI